jgi:osmoprotectant transport system ATP-binding protein
MIRFESVTKKYPGGGAIAVDNLNLTAPSGQITVLVGPSGCGKTTSLRMINRMIEPTSGRIWIDDTDTSKGSASDLRRGIGYVIQNAGLFPHRTIVDNVATVPYLLGQDKKQARNRAMELIERVGLDPAFATRYPAQLSGGQQQRVGVARALAADPPVMLMDEPFSAVDPVVREQLQREFLRLQSELGKTIVFVTHDIDEAIKLGDQVAVLRVGGHLAQMATPAELLARPADPFVAGFVGRDRGYRALGFTAAGHLDLDQTPAVRLGSDLAAIRGATEDGWALVVDDGNVPQGWISVAGVGADQLKGQITPDLLNLGGTLAHEDGTLREVLDAALSSPSGVGVVVDADGRLAGTITAERVLAQINDNRVAAAPASALPGPVVGGAAL